MTNEVNIEKRIVGHPIQTTIQILLAGISLSSSLVFAPIVLDLAAKDIEHIKYNVIAAVVLCAIGIIAGLVAFILRFYSLKQNDFRVKSNSIFYMGPIEIFLIEIASAIGMASYAYYKWNELLNVLKDFVCPVNICG